MGRIVVGVDESAGAAAALHWAVREAEVRDWSLTAVLAWGFLDQHHAIVGQPFDPSYGEADARAALDSIIAAAVGTARAATVEQKVVNDLAARALIDASDGADLLVVGARGLGRLRGLLLGSVSQQCLHHATCPVAVVRDGTQQSDERVARIVVGIDGSDTAGRALAWALEEGRTHQATVEVVHAWALPYAGDPYIATAFDSAPVEDAARRTLDAAVDSADTSGLPAPITRTLTVGSAAASVLQAAEGADLVVVGSRGLGGFKGLVLGSASYQIVHYATCPVVVVPPAVQ
jgi:nucleotide-binding universal stress UspA family protein